MKRERIPDDDRGITLVEVLISMAILSVILIAVLGFVIYSINQYHTGNREANLSNETQLLVARLEDMILSASDGVGTATKGAAVVNPEEMTGDMLYIYEHKTDATGTTVYRRKAIVPGADDKLYYEEATYHYDAVTGTGTWVKDGESELISNYVKGFQVDLTQMESGKSVTVTLDMGLRDKSYQTSNTFVVRNKVVTNPDNDYFSTLVKGVTSSEVAG